MAKTVAELQEEAKEKLKQEKNKKSQSIDESKNLEEANSKIAFLEAKMTVLEEQLNKSSSNEEEMRLAKEAEALKKQEETLRQEADVERILSEALKEEAPAKDEEGQLSQKDLVGIMAETVGKALDAQSKLTEGAMDKKLAESNKQIAGLQKVVIDLLGSMSVEKARGRFGADFDKYSKEASKIHTAHPSLSPEDAILLAKAQAESKQPDKIKVETEKPDEPPAWTPDRPFSTSRVSESGEEEHPQIGDQRQNFRRKLASAVDDYFARQSK